MFKLNKQYSNTSIQSKLSNITLSGAFEGGKHTIEGIDTLGNKYTFKMLSNGAWRGGKTVYYSCVKIAVKEN